MPHRPSPLSVEQILTDHTLPPHSNPQSPVAIDDSNHAHTSPIPIQHHPARAPPSPIPTARPDSPSPLQTCSTTLPKPPARSLLLATPPSLDRYPTTPPSWASSTSRPRVTVAPSPSIVDHASSTATLTPSTPQSTPTPDRSTHSPLPSDSSPSLPAKETREAVCTKLEWSEAMHSSLRTTARRTSSRPSPLPSTPPTTTHPQPHNPNTSSPRTDTLKDLIITLTQLRGSIQSHPTSQAAQHDCANTTESSTESPRGEEDSECVRARMEQLRLVDRALQGVVVLLAAGGGGGGAGKGGGGRSEVASQD